MNPYGFAGCFLLFAVLDGQTLASSAPPPPLPPLSTVFTGSSDQAPHDRVESWWRAYHDPVLDRLVADALTQNIDVQVAMARIDAARAQRGETRAARLPQVDLRAGSDRERSSDYAVGGPVALVNQYDVGVDVSWEADLFGRLKHSDRAALADVAANENDARAVRLALVAEVVRVYLSMRGSEERLLILERSVDAQNHTQLLTQQLYAAGAVPAADVDRATAQATTTAAGGPALKLERAIDVHRLALLLAVPAAAIEGVLTPAARASRFDGNIGAGAPVDLLRGRPDVMSAEARLLAAYERIGVARADMKPRLTLQGSIGAIIDGGSGETLARALAWLIGLSAQQSLFDGGSRRSVVKLRQAEAEIAALNYKTTVLGAVRDVEDALSADSTDAAKVALLRSACTSARRATEQITRAWKAGETPFIDVLEVQRSQLTAEDALARAQTDQSLDKARLILALGG